MQNQKSRQLVRLTSIALTVGVLSACAGKQPEPIYDASVYNPGKAGTLVETSPRPKPNPLLALAREVDRCWTEDGQHKNYPGCPWFAEGGGDVPTGGGSGRPAAGGGDSGPTGGGDGHSDDGNPTSGDNGGGDSGDDNPDNPTSGTVGNNPGNDKNVGKAGENPNNKGGWGSGSKGMSG